LATTQGRGHRARTRTDAEPAASSSPRQKIRTSLVEILDDVAFGIAAAAPLATDIVERATANTKAAERRRRVVRDMLPPISCG
jgi:hypothetical protein